MLQFTKPPLFQRGKLTGSGNPTFVSYVEGKDLYKKIEVYSRSSFQIHQDCTLFIEAQMIRKGLVLGSKSLDSQCTQNFPRSRFSVYTTFKSRIAILLLPLEYCCTLAPLSADILHCILVRWQSYHMTDCTVLWYSIAHIR